MHFVGKAVGTTSADLTALTDDDGDPVDFEPGDHVVVDAGTDAAATSPSLAAGYTSIVNGSNNTQGTRSGWKELDGSETSTGVWTNATQVIANVYRGLDPADPIGAAVRSGATGGTLAYPGLTMEVTDGTSWIHLYALHRSATNVEQTPGGAATVLRAVTGTEMASFDTNGGVASWAGANVTVNDSAGNSRHSIELRAAAETVVAIGQAVETDSAQPITTDEDTVVAIGQASEADTGQALSAARQATIGQALETDTALAVSLPSPWQTEVTIVGTEFRINGSVTYPGLRVEGTLLNLRCANAIFDDENPTTVVEFEYPDTEEWDPQRNTDEFCEFIPLMAAAGLKMFTVSLQGGRPYGLTNGENITSAFNADGSLKAAWKARAEQAIEAADAEGMVVVVGCFYFAQDQILTDNAAVQAGVENVVDWLFGDKEYTNVLLEIANEHNIGGFDHTIISDVDDVGDLAVHARTYALSEHGKTIYSSVSKSNAQIRSLLEYTSYGTPHLNPYADDDGGDEAGDELDLVLVSSELDDFPQPIVVNEDSADLVGKAEAAVSRGIGWGYHDSGTGDYASGFQWLPVRWEFNDGDKQAFRDWAIEESGAVSIESIGQATETDTAQPLTARKTLELEQASENDSAQPLTLQRVIATAQATENASAEPLTVHKVAGIGQATETDTSQPFAATKDASIGQASEADLAQPMTVEGAEQTIVPIDQALEADTAGLVTAEKSVELDQVVETDTADTVASHKRDELSQALETDTAQPIGVLKRFEIDQVQETDTALSIGATRVVLISQAFELNIARPLSLADTSIHIDSRQSATSIEGKSSTTYIEVR